ncbi:MAG: hypothetical protein NC099_01005 [Corallococcus sp.]|nr:hypothetical protein [Bacillota bacterium]MCM1533212.1 hypothetical protein [Corallococcus sp.]
MHRKYKEYFEQRGAVVNGEKAYGVINGYEVNFLGAIPYADMNGGNGGVTLHIAFYATEQYRGAIESEIKILSTKFVRYSFDKFGVKFVITDWTASKIALKIEEIVNKVCEILTNNNASGSGHCPICGMTLPEGAAKRQVEGMTFTLDDDCINKLNEIIEQENLEFEAAPNNYLKGFAGALIGGLAGALVAVLLYVVGFVSAISSFVAFFVGILLYRKFGGKPNKMMIVIVTATTFVCMIASVLGIYLYAAGAAGAEYGLNAFEAFSVLMKDEEFSRLFYADLALTVLFCVLGCVFEIVKTVRDIKRANKI